MSKEVFLGFVRPQDRERYKDSPLVGTYDGRPAAIWQYGPGGAPHKRTVGTTGGGKSSQDRMVLRGLVRKPEATTMAITIIDAEGAGEFTVFEGMPGVAQVINLNPAADAKLSGDHPTSVELAAAAIADHLALSVERNEERMNVQGDWLKLLKDPTHHRPPGYRPPGEVWLFIDGFATLCHVLNRYSKVKSDTIEDLTLTAMNGRKTDIHLSISDQVTYAQKSKDDDGMPSRLKKQLGCSIATVGRLGLTASEGRMAFDDDQAGRLVPPVPGGALMKIGASMLPYVVPPWDNATDPTALLSVEQRRAAYRLLPSPVDV